jgi:hypothetical protein
MTTALPRSISFVTTALTTACFYTHLGRLVKKANQALPDPLVLRARPVLRARKVLLFLQARPRTPFELYASTARPQRAEGVQPERGTCDRVLRSAQNSCDSYQRKNSHLSKNRGYQPSRHGVCEGGVIEKGRACGCGRSVRNIYCAKVFPPWNSSLEPKPPWGFPRTLSLSPVRAGFSFWRTANRCAAVRPQLARHITRHKTSDECPLSGKPDIEPTWPQGSF